MASIEDNTLYYLEGLAMNGLVTSYSKRNCGKGRAEVIAETRDRRVISTGCIDEKSVSRLILVLSLYSRWGKIINKSL